MRLTFFAPGDFEAPTGGYEYDRRIVAALRERGWAIDVRRLHESFPEPSDAALEDARAQLAALGPDELVAIDGLAFGAFPGLLLEACAHTRVLALVHHPLAAETGLTRAARERLHASERRALACARGVVVTSEATRSLLQSDFGVAGVHITVVRPGTRSQPLRATLTPGETTGLLCVATLIPRKGHDILLDALAGVRDARWSLRCVGSDTRDAATAAALRSRAHELGIADRVTFVGEVSPERMPDEYARADLFVLATRYEGYGMAVAESLAHGVPVLATRTGGIAELVPPDAGVLVEPGDARGFAGALARLLQASSRIAALAHGARGVRDTLPGWHDAAILFEQALRKAAS